jgi:hypothetical protein
VFGTFEMQTIDPASKVKLTMPDKDGRRRTAAAAGGNGATDARPGRRIRRDLFAIASGRASGEWRWRHGS